MGLPVLSTWAFAYEGQVVGVASVTLSSSICADNLLAEGWCVSFACSINNHHQVRGSFTPCVNFSGLQRLA